MKHELDSLLQRKMDRKDFMKHLALGFVALTGIAAVIKSMTGANNQTSNTSGSYGASTYGGSKK